METTGNNQTTEQENIVTEQENIAPQENNEVVQGQQGKVNFGGAEKIFAPIIKRNRIFTEKLLTILLICMVLVPAISIIERLVNPCYIWTLFSHKSPFMLPENSFLYKCYEFHVIYHLFSLKSLYSFFGLVLLFFMFWYGFGVLLRNAIEDKKKLGIGAFIKRYLWQCMFILLAVCMIIATFGASNSHTAVSGDAYRNEGLFTWLRYILIAFGAYLVRDGKNKRKILRAFALGSAFVCFIAIGQYYRWWIADNCGYSIYITSCFENSNHLAYYLVMAILVTGGLVATSKNPIETVLCGLLLAAQLATLIFNNTLGGMLAVTVAIIPTTVFFIIHALKRENRNKPLRLAKALIPIVVVVAVCLTMSLVPTTSRISSKNYTNGMSSLIKDIGVLMGNTSSSADTGKDNNASAPQTATPAEDEMIDPAEIERLGTNRIGLWKYGVKFLKERPIFGYGPEQLGELYYDTELENPSDRPHNEYLQYALFFGIPALIFYLGAVVVIFVKQIGKLKKLQPETLIAAGAVIGYLISAFFGNTMYYTTPLFFLLLGLAASPLSESYVLSGKKRKCKEEIAEAETAAEQEAVDDEAVNESTAA